MNDKKNIDRYFQEQFKDFEATPDPQVWQAINLSLHQRKKKRKAIPLWFKITGTAAAFLIGVAVLQKFKNTPLTPAVELVNQPKANHKETLTKQSILKHPNTAIPQHAVRKQQLVTNKEPNQTPYEKETIRTSRSKISSKQKKNQKDFNVHLQKNNSSVNTVATTSLDHNSAAANTSQNARNTTANTTIINTDPSTSPNKATATTASTTTNTLEEILKSREKQLDNSIAKKDKWKITPTVAALYLNTNATGSALDPALAQNEKTNDNSLSLGIGVHYALNSKINLRSGINRLAMGYNTTNVSYTAGLRSNTLSNIIYTSTSAIEISANNNQAALSSFEKSLQKNNIGTLSQRMNYFEIPFEMSYAVVQKKVGVHLIAGVSTMILNNNTVRLESSEFNETIGSATNLNPLHFSTNLGFGIQYKLIQSFQLSLEPMLKYQINTFTNNSSDFNPIVIGVYTGISYGF